MMNKISETITKAENFIHKELWDIDEKELPPINAFFLKTAKVLYIFLKGLYDKEFLTLASSLTFITAFSFIPLLALTFALAKGFGVQEVIQPILLKHTVGGIAEEMIPKVINYVNNTNVKALGYIGLIFIILTVLNVLSKIEGAFNKIWGVKQSRSYFRKFSDYISVLTVSPIFLVGAIGISTSLSSNAVTHKLMEIGLFAGAMKFFILLLPLLLICAALTLIYIFIPNTKVKLLPAITGGLVAGISWQLTQLAYISFQVGVSKYNAIYGTFATVPIFLMWVYISWVIVLAGAELCFAMQSVKHFSNVNLNEDVDYAAQEKIGLAIMIELCKEFENEESRSNTENIAEKINVQVRIVNEILGHLYAIGYVLPVEEEDSITYVPSKPTNHLLLSHFFEDFKHPEAKRKIKGKLPHVEEILKQYHQFIQDGFKEKTFKDFLK
ncbi:MAG: YihY/virulence factor BrkB family protein [Nitrospinae bacterium]|nr:YihY/virulence factor BrkB family protein [Nitrospinota bacterium]